MTNLAKPKKSVSSPKPKTDRVTILVGRHKGVSCTPLFYNDDTVIVIVKSVPYVYRHEDVESV